jgi:hypothetical protein
VSNAIKADPHPAVLTDINGQTLSIATSAPSAGAVGVVVYPVESSSVDQVQTAAEGPTGATAPADAIQTGGVDANGNLQANKINYVINGTAQVSIGTGATQIIAANATRAGVLVSNPSSTVSVYLGGSGVTTSTGQILSPGNSITLPVSSAIYGVVATSTQTVSYVELV